MIYIHLLANPFSSGTNCDISSESPLTVTLTSIIVHIAPTEITCTSVPAASGTIIRNPLEDSGDETSSRVVFVFEPLARSGTVQCVVSDYVESLPLSCSYDIGKLLSPHTLTDF